MGDEVVDLTSCAVCLEYYACDVSAAKASKGNDCVVRIPVQSAVCSHTMCLPCVKSLRGKWNVSTSSKRTWIPCPTCRSENAYNADDPIISHLTCNIIQILQQTQPRVYATQVVAEASPSALRSDKGKPVNGVVDAPKSTEAPSPLMLAESGHFVEESDHPTRSIAHTGDNNNDIARHEGLGDSGTSKGGRTETTSTPAVRPGAVAVNHALPLYPVAFAVHAQPLYTTRRMVGNVYHYYWHVDNTDLHQPIEPLATLVDVDDSPSVSAPLADVTFVNGTPVDNTAVIATPVNDVTVAANTERASPLTRPARNRPSRRLTKVLSKMFHRPKTV